ncbi:MAG: hypothetical protein ABI210_02605 [Abditibacteriaceae bacterium]
MTPRYWPESHEFTEECGGETIHLRQVTSAPFITHDIYCEQPYCTPDGNRFLMLRTSDPDPTAPGKLLMYDIAKYQVMLLEDEVTSRGSHGLANAPWSGICFTLKYLEKETRLVRWNLNTLEREEMPVRDEGPRVMLQSVSADHSFGVGSCYLGNGNFGIFRVDLQTGEKTLIYESPYVCNAHLQLRNRNCTRVSVQENRGCEVDETGRETLDCDERGAGLFSIRSNDGGDRRDFPVAPPFTPSTSGHETWIGDSDRVLVGLQSSYDDGEKCGTIVEASTDWDKPCVVFDSPYKWTHVSVSRCGKYFITDCYEQPGVPLLLGSIVTGQTRVLCHARTTGGGAQYSHAHPYLTSDNCHVVFNSDRTGVPQVYLARVPDGFLAALDA